MSKVKLKDMTKSDKNLYKYHKQVLEDLKTYGADFMERQALAVIERIEREYSQVGILLNNVKERREIRSHIETYYGGTNPND